MTAQAIPDFPGGAPRELSARDWRFLVALGAIVGGIVGPGGAWLRAAWILQGASGTDAADVAARRIPAFRLFTSIAGGVFFGVALVTTALLMPALLRWLARRATLPRVAYYGRAAGAGIVFGAAATAATGTLLALVALCIGALWPEAAGGYRMDPGAFAIGAPILSVATGLAVVPYFLPEAALLGVFFGLGFGALVRRRLASDA